MERHRMNLILVSRRAFSLLELILALALTALVSVLLGQLMQTYISQSTGPVERTMQAQEARKILTMIGDDLRGVVRIQTFDAAGLTQILMGPQQGGGQQSGGQQGGAQQGGAQGGQQPAMQQPAVASTGGSSMGGGQASAGQSTESGEYPPGIYGTSTNLELDISRIPRPDQYFVESVGAMSGKLVDVPSDTKNVSYFVQSMTTMGVNDPLSTATNGSGGLVRRQIDRAISKWANAQGQVEQLNRTGEMISTSVISIEFAYYNGVQWSYSWDSSVEGLPWAIEITIAMQDPVVARDNPVLPGTDLTTMDANSIAELGIQTYSSTIAIPGASLLAAPQPTQGAEADSGMGSLGL